ncbi:hypothetical protein THASP1DRAFT_31439, partial [Thamnocephalis sphaerospora]
MLTGNLRHNVAVQKVHWCILIFADPRFALSAVAAQAKRLLGTLFNIYSATPAESRGYILTVIQTYMGIISDVDVNATYRSVHQMLTKVLVDPAAAASAGMPDAGTLLDLAIGMIEQLDAA